MSRWTIAVLGAGLLVLGLAADPGLAARQQAPAAVPTTLEAPAPAPAASWLAAARQVGVPEAGVPHTGARQTGASQAAETPPEPRAVVERYCLVCHNDRALTGGLSLVDFEPDRAAEWPEVAEKIIRKLQAGMMPPAGMRRPDDATLEAVVDTLVARVDEAAAASPYRAGRTFQRLNRAEYRRSVEDLLGLDVDPAAYLPPDTVSAGFDNIADVQGLSATLLEGYLRAASDIARLAVGDPDASASEVTYKAPKTVNQRVHVEGAPFGTRGGVAVSHQFPADGQYVFKITLHPGPTGFLYGLTSLDERIEVSIDGARVAILDIDPSLSESSPNGMTIQTEAVAVKAGRRQVAAAFLQKFEGPVDDLMMPQEYTLADTMIGAAQGITTVPHLRDFTISGPFDVTGVSQTDTRARIFTCRPTAPGDEMPCARSIVERLATEAYRRPATPDDVDDLMGFYEQGATEGNFETGIRTALQAILASPHFVFRLEEMPEGAARGASYRVDDVDLAARLSYFLWATAPDAELLDVAAEGRLSEPGVLQAQVRRMLDDPRAEALATRFASQWLRLQDIEQIHPDALAYPQWDHRLTEAMRRETELLFHHLVQEDRPVLELLTADYTFVNERLADHYGIPGVAGTGFRRVELTDENRRGVLGHGSMLTLTSHANRTSPVLRGKWIMEVILGTPPPPPPPDVPDLEETDGAADGRLLTVREQLEQHRASPACASCHDMIDPLGLALENFDVTGAWRTRDNGTPVDTSGELYDGTPLTGPQDLRQALLSYSDAIIASFTENLMAYALGRRMEYFDMPTVRSVVRRAAADDYRMSAFILGVVSSEAFQRNADTLTEPEAVMGRAAGESGAGGSGSRE